MDNEWKNSLRERFSDYSAPEPEGLWEGIEQGIAGKPRRKMLPVWLATGLAAAAAVALVVFLPTRKATQPDVLQGQDRYAESVPADKAVSDTEPVEVSEAPVAEPAEAPVAKSVPFAVASRQTLLSEAASVPSVPVDEDRVPDAVSDRHSRLDTLTDRHSRLDRESVPVQETPVTEKEEMNEMPARKRFSVGAYGNGGQASTEQSTGYGMNRTGEYLTRATNGGAKKDVGGVVRMLSANRASTFEAHHAAPLRFGVTASYGLTRHLSLVSGLNWTYLNSEFEESAGSIRTLTGQDLGYLGIPLRLELGANILKGLWVYAGVGGMMEKGLMSKSWTNTFVDGQVAESKANDAPDMGGLLWSVGANAGAEYRFSPRFGLYFTPGVEYHFDNGSEVRSAYTEKPLHWNMNLGARFHFGI